MFDVGERRNKMHIKTRWARIMQRNVNEGHLKLEKWRRGQILGAARNELELLALILPHLRQSFIKLLYKKL